jgi:ribosomal protein S20
MSLENKAITARDSLKKAIKAGKNECATLATIINQIIDQTLWDYLDLPGDTAADKLHNLICLPYDQGGLNSQIYEVDALLTISSSTQRKFRTIVHAAKQGSRTDLFEQKENKVDIELSPVSKKSKLKSSDKNAKKPSSSQIANDRAAARAAEAIPEIDKLLDEGLIAKNVAAKVGQVVKDPKNPTPEESKVINNRQEVSRQLKELIPNPLPENPQVRKELSRQVKEIVEATTGKKSKFKITLGDPQVTAKAIAQVRADVDYLQELAIAIGLEVDNLLKAAEGETTKPKRSRSRVNSMIQAA